MRRLGLLFLTALFSVVFASSAFAAPAITGEFALPNTPGEPTLGPDGNVWVAITSMDPDFAKVAPDGTVTPFTAADNTIANTKGIVKGPDGNMWATMAGNVIKFSTANPTAAQKVPIADIINPERIIVGPDGNLWTASADHIIRIPPGNPAGFQSFQIAGAMAHGITAGGDGRLWVADGNGSVIPVSTAGVPGVKVTLGGMIQEVAAGPNGQIGYTNPGATPEKMGRIENGVALTPISFPVAPDPTGLIFARDQAYWTAQFATGNVGRMGTDGSYSTLGNFSAGSGPRHLTEGAGDTLWVTLEGTNRIGRISGVVAPNPIDTIAPVITKLGLTHTKFAVSTKKTATIAKTKRKSIPTGTTIRFTLSEPSTVTLEIQKPKSGKRSGRACVKPTKKLKKKRNCTRYVKYKTLTRSGKSGANLVAFSGRIGSKKLARGKYRLAITAKDTAGNLSKPGLKSFTIVKK